MVVGVDHVIYAVADLGEAAARLRATHGLGSIAGGSHPGWGTANRIVPLGTGYLELITVVDHDVASGSAFGRGVLSALEKDGGLAGWAVEVDDIEEDAGRLGLHTTSGERTRPDGQTLRWRLADVEEALSTGTLPFFIEWDGPAEWHPGRAVADHDFDVRGLAWVGIAADVTELGRWLGEHDLPLRMVQGPPGISAVGIATDTNELILETLAP